MPTVKVPNETKTELRQTKALFTSFFLPNIHRNVRKDWWSAIEGCEKVLTGDPPAATEVDSGHFWRVLKHFDVTCGTVAEASSADWSAKEGSGN